jgi:hypothetical protein
MIDVATIGHRPLGEGAEAQHHPHRQEHGVAGKGADAPPTWVRVVAFEDEATELATAEPGQLVYVEGALEAGIWAPGSRGSI